jgi:hypothetical protein
MSGGGAPPDNSVQVEQMQEAAAEKARQQAKDDAAAKATQLAGLRTQARSGASGSVNDYFSSQGVDPNQYAGQISSKLDSILGGIAPDDPNPGSAFTSAGPSVFDALTQANSQKAVSQLNNIFNPTYALDRVPMTLDDPYLDSINATQRSSADSILRNMLDRGVITQSGFAAGEGDLDKQGAGVKAQLNSFGNNVLTDEQNALTGIINSGRQTASGLKLGQQFDPFSYQKQADDNFSQFISNLSDTLKAKVGTGNLYTTSGLAGIAGAAQGAGNTAFDPTAASGIIDPNDPAQKKTQSASTPSTSTSIF